MSVKERTSYERFAEARAHAQNCCNTADKELAHIRQSLGEDSKALELLDDYERQYRKHHPEGGTDHAETMAHLEAEG